MENQLKKMLEYEAKAQEILDKAQSKADKIRGDAQSEAEKILKEERFLAEDEAERIREETIEGAKEEAKKLHARTKKSIQGLEGRAKKRMDKAASAILSEILEI